MGGQKTPPAPLVGQCVEALVARWPDLSPDDDEEDEDASPWSGLSTGGGKAAVTGRIAAGLDGLPAPARPCGPSARRAGRQPGRARGWRLRDPAGAALRTGTAGVLRPGDRPRSRPREAAVTPGR